MNNKWQTILQVFFFCHQRPDRSFHYKGKPFPICARCTGMAAGYISSVILVAFLGLLPFWLLIIFLIPMAIDGTGQLFKKWTSTNPRRFITGFLGGTSISFIFYTFGHFMFQLGQHVGNLI